MAIRIDHQLRRLFETGAVDVNAIQLVGIRPEGFALSAVFEQPGSGPVEIQLLPAGTSRQSFARLRGFDAILPARPGTPTPPAADRLARRALRRIEESGLIPSRADWMLTLGDEGLARFLSGDVAEIKLTAACDQACVFCKSPRNLANHAEPAEVTAALPALARRASFLTLSGGETTLAPGLPDVVRQARQAGFEQVEIQTNGMSLEDPARARELAAAGATNVLVSLHAHRPELSDRMTGTPGGFRRTLRGIDACVEAGLHVAVCHVICRANSEALVPWAGFVTRRFAGVPLQLVFTLAIPTYRVRDDPGLMPSLAELGPELRAALRRFAPARVPAPPPGKLFRTLDGSRSILRRCGPAGRVLGRRLGTLAKRLPGAAALHRARIIGHCGVPPCVLGEQAVYHDELWDESPAAADEEMEHPALCRDCGYRGRCSGLWSTYVERHGAAGIRAVPAEEVIRP